MRYRGSGFQRSFVHLFRALAETREDRPAREVNEALECLAMKDKFEKMLHAAAIMTDILMQQNIKPIIQWLEHALKEKSIVKKLRTPLMIQRLSEFLRLNAPSIRGAKALS